MGSESAFDYFILVMTILCIILMAIYIRMSFYELSWHPIEQFMERYRAVMAEARRKEASSGQPHDPEAPFYIPGVSPARELDPLVSLDSEMSDIRPELKRKLPLARGPIKLSRQVDGKSSNEMSLRSRKSVASTSGCGAVAPSSQSTPSSEEGDPATVAESSFSTPDQEPSTSGVKRSDTRESGDSSTVAESSFSTPDQEPSTSGVQRSDARESGDSSTVAESSFSTPDQEPSTSGGERSDTPESCDPSAEPDDQTSSGK